MIKKQDVLKIVSLLAAAEAGYGASQPSEAKAFSQAQETFSSCSRSAGFREAPGVISGTFRYHTNTNYDFKVKRKDGTVENFNSGIEVHKGDEIYASRNIRLNWWRTTTSTTNAPLPQISACPYVPEEPTDDGSTDDGSSCSSCSCDDGACFDQETKVLMVDSSEKSIKDVKTGDQVLCWDDKNQKTASGTVTKMCSAVRAGMYELAVDGLNQIIVSEEHPVYVKKENGYEGWAVINKEIMQSLKVASFIDRMEKLEIGDQLLTSQKQWKKISALQRITDREVNTMNIKRIDKFNNFFAGGILASTYEK